MRMMDLQALRYALATAPNPLEDPLTALRRQYVSQNPYLPSMPLPAGTTPASTTTEAKQVSNQIPVQSASARASTPPPLMKAERLNPEVDEDRVDKRYRRADANLNFVTNKEILKHHAQWREKGMQLFRNTPPDL